LIKHSGVNQKYYKCENYSFFMVKGLDASEEEILLVPACYNKKGLLGDFRIGIKDRGILRPYTSIGEYFRYFNDARYVYAYIEPVEGNKLFYKITQEDYKNNLEGLEPLVDIPRILVI